MKKKNYAIMLSTLMSIVSFEAFAVQADEVEKPEKITIMVNGDFQANVSEGQAEWIDAWESLTGIELEIIQPDHSSYDDVLNQTLASGIENWPDVIVTPSSKMASYAAEGVLWDMTDAYESSSIVANPEAKTSLVDIMRIDGSVYGIPLAGGGGCVTYIRQSWLDAVGMAVPTNWEEYLAMLDAFTNKDPDGNGIDDTYGTTMAGFGVSSSRFFPEFYQDAYPDFYINEDGQWADGFTEDSMKEALQRMQDAYAKGYIDPETLTNTTADCRTKFSEGRCGVFTYWAGNWAERLSYMLMANDMDGDLVSLVPIDEVGSYGQRLGAPIYSITNACENPEGVFKYFLESIFDDGEMQMLWMYGVEGVHWSKEAGVSGGVEYADGEFHMLESQVNPGSAWTFINCPRDNVLVPMSNDPAAALSNEEHDESQAVFDQNNYLEPMIPTNDVMTEFNGDLINLKNTVIANIVVQGADIEEEFARFEKEHGYEWSQAIVDALNEE